MLCGLLGGWVETESKDSLLRLRGETSFSTEPCTSFGLGFAAVWESGFRVPQLISSAARICRGCQFHGLLSQTRQAGGWCQGGFVCSVCKASRGSWVSRRDHRVTALRCESLASGPPPGSLYSPTLCVGGREMKIQKGGRLGQSHTA